MFDVFYIGVKPGLFPHERECNSIEHACELSRTRYFWIVNYLSDYTGWDWLWEPVPWENHQRHAWPSQWQKDSGTYLVPKSGYTETNYRSAPCVTRRECMENWITPHEIDQYQFDYSWHPDPTDPPFIYKFGTQWQESGGPVYVVIGATQSKYVEYPRAVRTSSMTNWTVPSDIDDFDFTWHPDDRDPPLIYEFGTQHQRTGGPRYVMPGATEIKYVPSPRGKKTSVGSGWQIPDGIDTDAFDWTWHPDATDEPYIYQFGTQWQKTGGPRYVMPGATEIKYVALPRATKISRDTNWQVPEQAELDSFDWTWHPDDTEEPYIYQFGTQHQRTGGPRYVVPGATEIKFVDQIKIKTQQVAEQVYIIDHLDGNLDKIKKQIKHAPCVVSRYFDNYLDTLKRIAKNADREKQEFIWIVSSVCDYADFDWTWHPEQWQAAMLHVFASDDEKFGDTFFMHVPSFVYKSETCKLLEWYDLNFVSDVSVPRNPLPIIHHNSDTHVEAVKTQTWAGPLAVFSTNDLEKKPVTVPLWREQTKAVVPLDLGAANVIVPKAAVPYVKTQLYDYPYIDRSHMTGSCDPLDIVFLSNGETNAEKNWEALINSASKHGKRNIHRIDRVNGRVASQHAAAEKTSTPWYFVVPAKLEISPDFDWTWQPDRMQQPKHYIFHALNPVNGLTYGHMAMVAYNKKLVLDTTGQGLDFTMEKLHDVVPILSGTAYFNDSPMMAWRTAFREVIKLKCTLPDVENEYRIKIWLTHGQGHNGEWSIMGAQDAVEYYQNVNGDFVQLKKSYEWAWLDKYAFDRRGLS